MYFTVDLLLSGWGLWSPGRPLWRPGMSRGPRTRGRRGAPRRGAPAAGPAAREEGHPLPDEEEEE
eukprot:3365610-Pyramimonas_sp.AAC.1